MQCEKEQARNDGICIWCSSEAGSKFQRLFHSFSFSSLMASDGHMSPTVPAARALCCDPWIRVNVLFAGCDFSMPSEALWLSLPPSLQGVAGEMSRQPARVKALPLVYGWAGSPGAIVTLTWALFVGGVTSKKTWLAKASRQLDFTQGLLVSLCSQSYRPRAAESLFSVFIAPWWMVRCTFGRFVIVRSGLSGDLARPGVSELWKSPKLKQHSSNRIIG